MNADQIFAPTPRQVCGQCHDEWLTEDEYNNHLCPTTNATPQQVEHFGTDFAAVQKAALERGLERIPATDVAQIQDQQAAIAEVDQQLQ